MADSLVLTGVKDIKKHTGNEMLLTRPKRGGDTHSLKEWWKGSGVSTCYAECTVFDVTVGGDTCKLAIDSSMGTNLRIDHDGAFNFEFFGINEVKRGALFTDAFELIEHYVFPAISGGKVMTVIPLGAASKPGGAPPATSIGNVTITGEDGPADGTTQEYNVTIDGDAVNLAYSWSVDQSGTISGDANGDTVQIVWSGTDASTVTCSVSSTDAGITDSPQSGTLSVTPV